MSEATDLEKLSLVDPRLGSWYWSIHPLFAQQYPGSYLTIAQGFRTPSMQQAAHAAGESKANGTTTFSKHQLYPSQAIDIMVVEGAMLVTNGSDQRYAWLAEEARKDGLFPGADFKSASPDFDHFELLGPQPNAEAIAAAITAYRASTGTAASTA